MYTYYCCNTIVIAIASPSTRESNCNCISIHPPFVVRGIGTVNTNSTTTTMVVMPTTSKTMDNVLKKQTRHYIQRSISDGWPLRGSIRLYPQVSVHQWNGLRASNASIDRANRWPRQPAPHKNHPHYPPTPRDEQKTPQSWDVRVWSHNTSTSSAINTIIPLLLLS